MNTFFYHKYLNLPFDHPKPKRFDHPADGYAVLIDRDAIYPPFEEWINSLGLKISNVLEAFYTKPNGGRVPLHSDTSYIPGIHDICKLNFTWGPSDSTTQWYKIKDESKLKKYEFGKEGANKKFYDAGIIPDIDIEYVLFADLEDGELVYEAVIDRPSLLNISQLHTTWNPSLTEDRWTLCYTLLENGELLTVQRASEIFKNYITE
jgi:hypothetical protein